MNQEVWDAFYKYPKAKELGIGSDMALAPRLDEPLLDQLSRPVLEFYDDRSR